MGWDGDEPGKDKDKWSNKGQPPDLDEALKRFQAKFKKTLRGGGNRSGKSKSGNSNMPRLGGFFALGLLAVVAILWFLSGIFIVDPAEQAAILRFGKYIRTVGPGPHWIPRFIDRKIVVNVEKISDYTYSAHMLAKDENIVSVTLAVQYRINDLEAYLFNVADPEESLQQAISSALRQVVGRTTLDQIIAEGREAWGANVQDILIKILESYKTGIVILSVSPQPARVPESVQDAFDDAIKAQVDAKRFKEQAEAYEARVIPIAKGNAERTMAEAKAEAEQVILRAKGEVAEFLALLPEYKKSPQVMAERMYADAIQQVLTKTSKILIGSSASNLLYLPLDKMVNTASKLEPLDPSHQQKMQSQGGTQTESNEVVNRTISRDLIRPVNRPERNW